MINKKQNQHKNECHKNSDQQLQISVQQNPSNTISEQLSVKASLSKHKKRQDSQGRQTSKRKPKDSKDNFKLEQNPERMKKQKFKAGQFKRNVKLIFNLKKKLENNMDTSREQIVSDLQAILKSMGPLAKFHDKLQKFTKFVVFSEEKLKEMQNLIQNLQVQNKIIKKQLQKLQKQLQQQSQELHGLRTKTEQQKRGLSQDQQPIKVNQSYSQLLSQKRAAFEHFASSKKQTHKDSYAFSLNIEYLSMPMFQVKYEKPLLIQFSQLQPSDLYEQILRFKFQKNGLILQLNQLQTYFDQISQTKNINLFQLQKDRQLLSKKEAAISHTLNILAILFSLNQARQLTKDNQQKLILKENQEESKTINSELLYQSYLASLTRLTKSI